MMDVTEIKRTLSAIQVGFRELEDQAAAVQAAGAMVGNALLNRGQVFLCGNGGSAADAQHLAAELTGRFLKERKPLPAMALNANTSAITAIANDYSYDAIYERQIRAHGRKGDVLVAISTSGKSKNILLACRAALDMEMRVIGLTGQDGGEMGRLCELCLRMPSRVTPRIQEMHIAVGHIICEIVDGYFD